MKKIAIQLFSAIVCLLVSDASYGQQFTTSGSNIISGPTSANVGIGNFHGYPTPIDKLTVGGNISLYSQYDWDYRSIMGRVDGGGLFIRTNSGSTDGAGIEFYGRDNGSYSPGSMHFISHGTPTPDDNSTNYGYLFYNYDPNAEGDGDFFQLMKINKDGTVIVGDNSVDVPQPAGYRLYVQTGILTEKVKVALRNTSDWSDYVFASDYELMPINKLEQFVQSNKHLPNVPSAEEVVKDGIDMASMDAKLLEKIEELTLYVIQQHKQIQAQQNDIDMLKQK